MDASIATAIIGLLGAAVVGGLGFILQGLRGDIRIIDDRTRTNGERVIRVEERVVSIEERVVSIDERMVSEFGEVKRVLVRIEAMQPSTAAN